MPNPTPANAFRALLSGPDLIVAPGAYDALTARLIEQAGFPPVYMTVAGTAAARELFRGLGSEDWDAISRRFAAR